MKKNIINALVYLIKAYLLIMLSSAILCGIVAYLIHSPFGTPGFAFMYATLIIPPLDIDNSITQNLILSTFTFERGADGMLEEEQLNKEIEKCKNKDELRGIEGEIAKNYFSIFMDLNGPKPPNIFNHLRVLNVSFIAEWNILSGAMPVLKKLA